MTTQAVESGPDRGGMVREVVIDMDLTTLTPDHTAQFHAAPHVVESVERGRGVGRCHADMLGGGDGCQRVHLVVPPGQ